VIIKLITYDFTIHNVILFIDLWSKLFTKYLSNLIYGVPDFGHLVHGLNLI
jgi:hypothetical protein